MKYIVYLIIPLVFISLYGGCNDGNDSSGEGVLENLCFQSTSDNPCFDSNVGGETTYVNDMNIEEVIFEERSKPGFIGEIEFTKIFSTFKRSFFLPPVREECIWEDSGLVIKNSQDWDKYRNNCYFTDHFLIPDVPDVDFLDKMLILSLKGGESFGTEILAVLEFENELVAVISDLVSDIPSSESGMFGTYIVELERKDLPVSFLRVGDVCNSYSNFSNSQCLAESMVNICENSICFGTISFGTFPLRSGSCSALDCTTIDCDGALEIFTNIALNEINVPVGLVFIEGEDIEFACGVIVE